jgi:hypothetical protein
MVSKPVNEGYSAGLNIGTELFGNQQSMDSMYSFMKFCHFFSTYMSPWTVPFWRDVQFSDLFHLVGALLFGNLCINALFPSLYQKVFK